MSGSRTRLKIGGKIYKGVSIDEISLDDIIVFDGQASDAGWGMTFDDLEALTDKADTAPDTLTTREGVVLAAVTVWLCRRAAGEDVTLKEAARVPTSSIEQITAPGDKAPKGKSKKSSPRKASARVALVAADPEAQAPATSTPQSASA